MWIISMIYRPAVDMLLCYQFLIKLWVNMVFEFNIRGVVDKTMNKNNKIPRSPKDARHQLHK